MKHGLTDITVLLDRSGSMQPRIADTIGGFNHFVNEQKKADGEAIMTLVQFNHDYTPIFTAKALTDVPMLDVLSYVPNGNTALLDALGRLILDTGKRLSDMPEDQRPEKVIFVIITDGEENSSRIFTNMQVNDMVNHQRDVYKWLFIYLGANQDAFAQAGNLGVQPANSLNYGNTTQAIGATYTVAAGAVKRARSKAVGASAMTYAASFTPEERNEVVDDPNAVVTTTTNTQAPKTP